MRTFVLSKEQRIKTNRIMMNLNSLINRIEFLEAKQEDGTITMTESTMLLILIEKAEEMLSRPALRIVK